MTFPPWWEGAWEWYELDSPYPDALIDTDDLQDLPQITMTHHYVHVVRQRFICYQCDFKLEVHLAEGDQMPVPPCRCVTRVCSCDACFDWILHPRRT